jgi:hypothetical protein
VGEVAPIATLKRGTFQDDHHDNIALIYANAAEPESHVYRGGGVRRLQVLQYDTLGAEKYSTYVLAVLPCCAERTARGAVRMRLS